VLGCAQAVLFDVRDEVVDLVDEEAGNADETGDADGQEAEANLAEVEMVDGWVDKREDFEEGVVDAVG
jgi:hypothetical protein